MKNSFVRLYYQKSEVGRGFCARLDRKPSAKYHASYSYTTRDKAFDITINR